MAVYTEQPTCSLRVAPGGCQVLQTSSALLKIEENRSMKQSLVFHSTSIP